MLFKGWRNGQEHDPCVRPSQEDRHRVDPRAAEHRHRLRRLRRRRADEERRPPPAARRAVEQVRRHQQDAHLDLGLHQINFVFVGKVFKEGWTLRFSAES